MVGRCGVFWVIIMGTLVDQYVYFGIMSCSYLTSHPSGLIPIPFVQSASRPFELLSFSFFRFFYFLLKMYLWFYRFIEGCIYLFAYISISVYAQKRKTIKT